MNLSKFTDLFDSLRIQYTLDDSGSEDFYLCDCDVPENVSTSLTIRRVGLNNLYTVFYFDNNGEFLFRGVREQK